jgi:hypothetical protein
MESKTSLNSFVVIFHLLKFDFIPKRKLTLFFIGVFIISLITTVMTGYVTGIQQKNYFFPESDDVLVLFDRKASTPITGFIEENFAYDLRKIDGIEATSPEIYSTGVISDVDRPAILHGITKDYLSIHPLNMIDGVNILEKNISNLDSVMIGVKLASILDLKVNSKIHFNSALKETSRTFTVAGIFQTNSAADEEIFTSIDNALGFSWVPVGFVTLIQVKFNTNIILKSKILSYISNIVSNQFKIITKPSLETINVNDLDIKVYGFNNRILLNFRSEADLFDLALPFGSYKIVISSNSDDFVNSFDYFALKNSTIITPLSVGYDTYNLSLSVFYDNKIQPNFKISVLDQINNRIIYDHVIIDIENLVLSLKSNRDYFISVSNNIMEQRFFYSAIDHRNLTIILDTGLTFQVTNSTTTEQITDFSISVFNSTDNQPIDINNRVIAEKNYIKLQPGEYFVNVSKGFFSSFYNVLIDKIQPLFQNFILGYLNITYVPQGTSGELLEWEIYDNNSLIMNDSSTGNITFILQSYHNYLVKLFYKTQINTFSLYPDISTTYNISLQDSYTINLYIFNGTEKSFPGIESALITLSTGPSLSPDASGFAQITLNEMNIFDINITYLNYTTSIFITDLEQYSNLIMIPIGDQIHIVLYSKTENNETLPNQNIKLVIVSLFNQDIFEFSTNENGVFELFLPVTPKIGISTLYSEYYFFAAFSTYVELNLTFPTFADLFIDSFDIEDQIISDVFVQLFFESENSFNLLHEGFTDNTGHLLFLNILQGNYKYIATYRDLTQEGYFSITNSSISFSITFFINIVNIKGQEYLHFNAFRNIKIDNPSEYIQSFLSTTLGIFLITMIITVFITIFLMFLSIESIITFPLYQHKDDINSLRMAGGTNFQIATVLSLKLAYYSFFGSLLGVISSSVILFSISSIGTSNFGGLIFQPIVNPFFSLLTISFIFLITFIISFNYLVRRLLPDLVKS